MSAQLLLHTWRRLTRRPVRREDSARASAVLVRWCVNVALRRYRSAMRGGQGAAGEAVFTVELGEARRRTWRLPNAIFVNFFEPESDALSGHSPTAAPFAGDPALLSHWQESAFREAVKAELRSALASKGIHVSMFVESPAHREALGAVLRDNRIGRAHKDWAVASGTRGLVRA